MAEQEQEPAETETPESESAPSNAQLAADVSEIKATLAKLIGGGQPAKAEPEAEAPDIKAEVRAELAKLRAKDKAEEAKAAEQAEHESLKEQVAKLTAKAEEKPFEYKRATNVMGWAKP
jgi:hypothetical protein